MSPQELRVTSVCKFYLGKMTYWYHQCSLPVILHGPMSTAANLYRSFASSLNVSVVPVKHLSRASGVVS